jgi:hypothetical protein
MTHHRCKHPLRHQTGVWLAMGLWIYLTALGLPWLVVRATQSTLWAWVSLALAWTVGLMSVKGLAYRHCQPLPTARGGAAVRHLALLSWTLREER